MANRYVYAIEDFDGDLTATFEVYTSMKLAEERLREFISHQKGCIMTYEWYGHGEIRQAYHGKMTNSGFRIVRYELNKKNGW